MGSRAWARSPRRGARASASSPARCLSRRVRRTARSSGGARRARRRPRRRSRPRARCRRERGNRGRPSRRARAKARDAPRTSPIRAGHSRSRREERRRQRQRDRRDPRGGHRGERGELVAAPARGRLLAHHRPPPRASRITATPAPSPPDPRAPFREAIATEDSETSPRPHDARSLWPPPRNQIVVETVCSRSYLSDRPRALSPSHGGSGTLDRRVTRESCLTRGTSANHEAGFGL